ncbi:Uncharacterised protein [Megamonas hypermegale]|uniref:Outer membrane protein (OmpH-like) n=1 Tax=Megamonas hypermegale TaxID=158847 RepID=A0A239T9N8_9FIRM|nr:hypothetical protein [Megamonas hypermegale]MBM6760714.1 hypothetical protein [Megamonas hypermegale]SNU94306.1 Uncharacterised protein [Megamonas hypermegale]
MQEKEAKQAYNKRNVAIGGIVCLLLIMIGIGYYIWHKNAKTPQPIDGVTSAIAVVDVDKLMPEHVNYNKLLQLQAEKFLILEKLKSYATDTASLEPPEVNPAPNVFENVVDQQDNLRDINLRQQIKEETAVKENEIRANLAEEKNAAIKEITDKYTNEILNCTLKLDNAKNLRLNKEQQDELLDEMERLKVERGKAVFQIEQQFNLRVANELMAWRAEREKQLGLNNLKQHQADVEDSQQRIAQEQQRNNQYMQDRLNMLQARKKDSERLIILLHTKNNEIELLKKSILKDISSKAAKVAIQKHLKLVVANVPFSDNFLGNADSLNFDNNVLNGMVVGVDAIDITDDILTLLRSDREKALQNDKLDNTDDSNE